jgi:hypothetical protein
MAILTQSGRTAIANALSKRPLHVAWGTGDGVWLTPPSESVSATSLMAEIGRREITQWAFIVPDVAGAINIRNSKYSLSPGGAPTRYLYVEANFDFSDASGSVVREVAVFSDAVLVSGLPSGQKYFAPSEVAAPGIMLYLENIDPIFRSPAIQENFRTVIIF